jgi:surface antigen
MRHALAIGLVSCAALASGGAAAAGVVTYGYPYASHCPGAGVAERVDRWGMYACNCTSYVAWALVANHQRTDWFVPGAMDAWNWPQVARKHGLRVAAKPRVGAVAVWPHASRFGHVAYVTHVDAGGLFDVAEYNLPGAGAETFAFDTRTDVSPSGAVFVYVPRRAPSERRAR